MTSELITTEIQKLAPSAVIELFELDATSLGGDVSYFHAGTNGLKANVVWQGQTYTRFPVEATGFEYSGNGQMPRPKMRVSNLFGSITSLLLAYNDLLGAKLTRKRTLAKYLDAVNFDGGVNPDEDTTAEFPEEIYFVDRKAVETPEVVEFELAAALDLAGVRIPRRQIIQNICPWIYRGSECGYTGGPLFDDQDEVLTTTSSAEGQAVLDAYAAIQTAREAFEAADTALTAASQSKDLACEYYLEETRYTNTSTDSTPEYGVFQTTTGSTAYWNSVVVALGVTYRVGPVVQHLHPIAGGNPFRGNLCKIERWEVDTAACSAATTAFNTAESTRNTALATLQAAQATYTAALAALPSDDPLYDQDRCGKRLASCEARFGDNEEIPFGGFPSAALIR